MWGETEVHQRRIILSQDAENEYKNLLYFSYRRWGWEHQQSFRTKFQAGLNTLANAPYIGKSRDDLLPGIRSFPISIYVVYYQIIDETLRVIHILSDRQNEESVEWPGEIGE